MVMKRLIKKILVKFSGLPPLYHWINFPVKGIINMDIAKLMAKTARDAAVRVGAGAAANPVVFACSLGLAALKNLVEGTSDSFTSANVSTKTTSQSKSSSGAVSARNNLSDPTVATA